MIKVFEFAFAFLGSLWQVSSKLSLGGCPDPQLKQNFDSSLYTGVWYEQARDKAAFFERGECSQAKYTLNPDGSIRVENSELRGYDLSSVDGRAVCNGARCKVSFSPGSNGDYRVVDTDYENFAVVYSCAQFLFVRFDLAWVLTRAASPDTSVTNLALDILDERVPQYDQSSLRSTYQGVNCAYANH